MFRPLLRKHQELSMTECVELLKTQKRGVLSVLGDHDYPYGMPMNHWYNEQDGALYFHCGKQGHRVDALNRHDKVSFCVYDEGERSKLEWAYRVKSVIVFGRIEQITDLEQVIDFTTRLSLKFTQDMDYIRKEIEQAAHKTLLLRLQPEHMCGKSVLEA